jgi:hypothetical protein
MPRANRLFLTWIRLAHHAPLPSEAISTKVRARSASLSALRFRSKEAVRSIGAQLYGDSFGVTFSLNYPYNKMP